MPDESDYPARGRIIAIREGMVVFQPAGTSYELYLATAGAYTGPRDTPVEGLIRVEARKIWTVPSGGNFIEPIFGPPRIVQGRVRYLTERVMVVQAGVPVVVRLPSDDAAFDLNRGPIAVGKMVNVAMLPGAAFELLQVATAT